MPAFMHAITQWESLLVWGFVATSAMTVIMYGSQGMGLSRLSLPFLVGTWLSGNRTQAVVLGLVVYIAGGWIFALAYAWLFAAIGIATWWLGLLVGLLHGLFLLVVALPVLPYLHPRMASEYSAPEAGSRLEPPGFLGLNYGHRTPLITLLGMAVYGMLLGYGLDAMPPFP